MEDTISITPQRPRMTEPELQRITKTFTAPEERLTKLEGEVAVLRTMIYAIIFGLIAMSIARYVWTATHPPKVTSAGVRQESIALLQR